MPTASTSPKALIIGIDGGSFDIVDALVAQGRLPNLAGLLRRGASAPTTCTWPAHTAPGWSSFVTGRQPGGHGIYQFFDTQEPSYGARIMGPDDLGCGAAWDWLSGQGYTLGLVNVPMSHPPRPLPGYQVTWPLQQTTSYCRPRSLLAELAREGAHFRSDLVTMFRGDLGYLEEAEANVAARVRSVAHLLRTRPTDVLMLVLTEADRVCHHYWHFCDPAHPRHAEAPPGSGWDAAIERIYRAIDAAVGELLALVDEDTSVVVASDHGLGVGRYGVAVHRLLEEAGLLATAPSWTGAGNGTASWFSDGDRTIDFDRTHVYMPVPGSYGLNVNLRGRQHRGIVDEADAGAVLDEAVAALADVTTPDGLRVFEAIAPREAAYPGANTAGAPDLLLVPRNESVLAVGELTGDVWRPSWQTGLHRYRGMWIHASPRVRPQRLAEPVRLVDLMPTLLADIGAGWPEKIHGRPLVEVLDPALGLPPPFTEQAAAGERTAPGDAPAGEDEFTSRRLREMGYL